MKRTTTSRTLASLAAAFVACAGLPVRPAHGLAAGIVVVTVDGGGKANVTGNDAGADITVTWDGVTGAYTITGGNGTTVNGAASVSVTGVKTFVVSMGDGNDSVVFDHTPIPGNLNVRLHDGDDSLDLAGVTGRGGAKLFGGYGNDTITVRDQTNFKKSLTIRGGPGDDTIVVKNTKLNGYVRVLGGPNDDHVTLNAIDFDGWGDLAVLGNNGNDWLGVAESTFHRPFWAGMGRGSDLVTIDSSNFDDRVGLVGGGADDMLHIGSDVDWSNSVGTRATEFERGDDFNGQIGDNIRVAVVRHSARRARTKR
jgi:hypothetical protein